MEMGGNGLAETSLSRLRASWSPLWLECDTALWAMATETHLPQNQEEGEVLLQPGAAR